MKPIPLTITVSDPWDLGETVNWQPIKGQLIQMKDDERGGQALVKFDAPLSYRGLVYHYAVASPRLEGNHMVEVNDGKMVCSALIGISDQQAESNNPLDISRWRGGLGFDGDVQPL